MRGGWGRSFSSVQGLELLRWKARTWQLERDVTLALVLDMDIGLSTVSFRHTL